MGCYNALVAALGGYRAVLFDSSAPALEAVAQRQRGMAAMLVGAVFSFVFAYLAIHWFLKLIEKTGMLPYIIYRVVLGVILLFLFM